MVFGELGRKGGKGEEELQTQMKFTREKEKRQEGRRDKERKLGGN